MTFPAEDQEAIEELYSATYRRAAEPRASEVTGNVVVASSRGPKRLRQQFVYCPYDVDVETVVLGPNREIKGSATKTV